MKPIEPNGSLPSHDHPINFQHLEILLHQRLTVAIQIEYNTDHEDHERTSDQQRLICVTVSLNTPLSETLRHAVNTCK